MSFAPLFFSKASSDDTLKRAPNHHHHQPQRECQDEEQGPTDNDASSLCSSPSSLQSTTTTSHLSSQSPCDDDHDYCRSTQDLNQDANQGNNHDLSSADCPKPPLFKQKTLSMRKVSSWSGPLSLALHHHHKRQRSSCLPTTTSDDRVGHNGEHDGSRSSSSSLLLKLLPRALAKFSILLLAVAALTSSPLTSSSSHKTRQRALGSAAIASVTETLSPILPFTGGMDLRKEWSWEQVWRTVSSSSTEAEQQHHEDTASDATDADHSLPTHKHMRQRSSQKTTTALSHKLAISASDCFLNPQTEIGQLTLDDVSQVIRYAMECNRAKFDETKFLTAQLPRVRTTIQAMNKAVQASRGKGVELSLVPADAKSRSKQGSASSPGSMDALLFAAAMRIFGEWRMVRQVPDGYKGYAVGMSLGHKDIVQNVAKVEAAVHAWLDTEAAAGHSSKTILRSPTLAQLMEHEADTGVHPNLPRLKDRTGAMGLLWVRRQLQYQTQTFENVVQTKFQTTTDAVSAAYDTVYNQYHGWAVQKIFSYSFQAAPDSSAIFRHMNPHKLQELRNSKPPSSSLASSKSEALEESESNKAEPMDASKRNKEEHHPVVQWFKKLEKDLDDNPVVSWFKKVGDDSKKLVEDVRDKIFPHLKPSSDNDNNDEASSLEGNDSSQALEDYITQEMTRNAHENIDVYLAITRPLLDDLARVFAKYNMDDPTKV